MNRHYLSVAGLCVSVFALCGCEGGGFGPGGTFSIGSENRRSGNQVELNSLSSIAIDPAMEFTVPGVSGATPINALQSGGHDKDYFIVETFGKKGTGIDEVLKQLTLLQELSIQLETARAERATRQVLDREARKDRLSALERIASSKSTVSSEASGGDSAMRVLAEPESTDASSALARADEQVTNLQEQVGDASTKIAGLLAGRNILIVDWNELGAAGIAGSYGPISAEAKKERRGDGIAILNGIRKIRRVSPAAQFNPKDSTERYGDGYSRPRTVSYMLQAEEVLFFATDDRSRSAKLNAQGSTGSGVFSGLFGSGDTASPIQVGVEAGGSRVSRLAGFGSLAGAKVERMSVAQFTALETNQSWITVQAVGTPTYAQPRSISPASGY